VLIKEAASNEIGKPAKDGNSITVATIKVAFWCVKD